EQLRLAQAELEAERERYVQLFDFAPVGYLTLAKNGLILRANITSGGMLGVERSRLPRKPFLRFVFGPDKKKYYSWWPQVVHSHDSQSLELRLQPANGQIIYVHLKGVWANEDERIVCRLTISDIAEQRLAEEQARKAEAQRAREELAHLSRVTMLGELAGSLA